MNQPDFQDNPNDPNRIGGGGTASPAETDSEAVPVPEASTPDAPESVEIPGLSDDSSSRSLARPDQPTVISKHPLVEEEPSSTTLNLLKMGRVLEGERLSHFQLEKFVGGGGMGAVFRATDTMLGRTVAVKVLSQDQSADSEALRRFKNEAQSAARLDHENIARVYYVGEDRGWNFIVFEFIDGINIRDLVEQRGPLTLEEAAAYVLQVAEALAHASRRDVVHRDIKPSNILITREGRAKLVDMGLARLHQVHSGEDDLTASGVTLGTFDYISPEQARDPRMADVRSDLYSLGCTLFYMLTGRPPFPEGTVLQKLLNHSSEPPPDVREFRPEMPEEVVEIIDRLLAKAPEDRYQQPSELIGALLMVAERFGLSGVLRGGTVWIAPREKKPVPLWRHLPWVVPLLMLGVFVLTRHFLFSASPSEPPPEFVIPLDARAETPSGPIVPPPSGGQAPTGPASIVPPVPTPAEAAGGGEAAPPKADAPVEPIVAAGDAGQAVPLAVGDENRHPPAVATDETAASRGRLGAAELGGSLSAAPEELDVSAGGEIPPPTSVVSPAEDAAPTTVATPDALDSIDPTGTVFVLTEGTPPPPGMKYQAATLEAALALVEENPDIRTIRLLFDGPQIVQPMRIAAEELTIGAAPGYRPVLVFRPTVGLPVQYPREMIHLIGGRLKFEGLHFDLEIPREPVEYWSLLRLYQVESLALDRCTATIRNAGTNFSTYHEQVAFFDFRFGDSAAPAVPSTGRIELRDCIFRGEAALVHQSSPVAFSLDWENGLLAGSEPLLDISEAPETPAAVGPIEIRLNHVTAVASGGLCRMVLQHLVPESFSVRLELSECLLQTGSAPLVMQRGIETIERFQKQIVYRGTGNAYRIGSPVWRIDTFADDRTWELDFDRWKTYWNEHEQGGESGTQVVSSGEAVPPTKAFSTYTTGDFPTPASSADPSAPAAPVVGALIDRLPALPAETPAP